MMYRNWGNFFFSKKKYFRLVELGPKFGIWSFSAIYALFFRVPKNLIYINNAFNGYRYLKSTRKELSDGTLMLKKEYCLDRWNCDWKSYDKVAVIWNSWSLMRSAKKWYIHIFLPQGGWNWCIAHISFHTNHLNKMT